MTWLIQPILFHFPFGQKHKKQKTTKQTKNNPCSCPLNNPFGFSKVEQLTRLFFCCSYPSFALNGEDIWPCFAIAWNIEQFFFSSFTRHLSLVATGNRHINTTKTRRKNEKKAMIKRSNKLKSGWGCSDESSCKKFG